MGLKKTQLLDVVSVIGINTVGILTVGVTQCSGGVGIASTTFIRSVIMHNTGLGTARVSLYVDNFTTPILAYGVTASMILRVDMAPNETTFFESNYPIVLEDKDTLSVEVAPPDGGGTGIGSMVNFIVNGDTSIE